MDTAKALLALMDRLGPGSDEFIAEMLRHPEPIRDLMWMLESERNPHTAKLVADFDAGAVRQ